MKPIYGPSPRLDRGISVLNEAMIGKSGAFPTYKTLENFLLVLITVLISLVLYRSSFSNPSRTAHIKVSLGTNHGFRKGPGEPLRCRNRWSRYVCISLHLTKELHSKHSTTRHLGNQLRLPSSRAMSRPQLYHPRRPTRNWRHLESLPIPRHPLRL